MAVDCIAVARPALKVPADVYLAEYRELQEFVQRALIAGADYGTIGDDGRGKAILFLPGAEKLADAYGLISGAPELMESVERWDDEIILFHYIVRVPFRDRATGSEVGWGVGSCNSLEIKYRYRSEKVWCNRPADSQAPPDDSEGWELKSTQKGKKYWQRKVANSESPDLANTILKMAAKRAYVDGVLKTLRASALFTQDIEDMPQHLVGGAAREVKEFFCTRKGCGTQITDAKIGKREMTAEQIAAETAREFGGALCPSCWKSAIEERRAAKAQESPPAGPASPSEAATNPTMARISLVTKIGAKEMAYGGAEKVTELARTLVPDCANWRDIQDAGVLSEIHRRMEVAGRAAA